MVRIVWVMTDTYNFYHTTYACVIPIVPLSSITYKIVSRYNYGEIEYDTSKYDYVYLTKRMKRNVEYSLLFLNLEPRDFIEKVTPHSEWKKTMNQGVVFKPLDIEEKHLELPELNMSEYRAIEWLKEKNIIKAEEVSI
jgi:hypothetical protein